MPQVEVSLPEDVYVQFERLAEEEFLSEEEAVSELLRLGLDAYDVEEPGSGLEEDVMDEMSEIFDNTEGRAEEDPGL
jgi:metal-responsive CopG/Arc/MetJ family transcriptional regulator